SRLLARGVDDDKVIASKVEAFSKTLVREIEDKREVSEMLYLMRLLQDIKKTPFGSRVRTFVATRPFDGDTTFAQQVFALLKYADITSSNEAEVRDLHTA